MRRELESYASQAEVDDDNRQELDDIKNDGSFALVDVENEVQVGASVTVLISARTLLNAAGEPIAFIDVELHELTDGHDSAHVLSGTLRIHPDGLTGGNTGQAELPQQHTR